MAQEAFLRQFGIALGLLHAFALAFLPAMRAVTVDSARPRPPWTWCASSSTPSRPRIGAALEEQKGEDPREQE